MRCCAKPASSPIAVASSHGSSAGSRIGRGSGVCSPSHHAAVDRPRRRQLTAIAGRVRERPEDLHPVRRDARLVLERAVRDDLRVGGEHAHHGRRARAAQRRQQERLQARLEGAAQRRARAAHERQRAAGCRPPAAPRAAARTRGPSARALSVPKNPLRCACGSSGWRGGHVRAVDLDRQAAKQVRRRAAPAQRRPATAHRPPSPAGRARTCRPRRRAGERRAQSLPVRRPAGRATPR